MKKIVIGVVVLVAIALGTFVIVKGKDTYDPSKYYIKAENGLKKGSVIDFKLPDQFDKAYKLKNDTRLLIVVFAKSTGHTVKAFLKDKPKGFLESKSALFIADISPMPVVIRNAFALPDLRKSDYSVLLIYDKKLAAKLKNRENADKITLVYLENKKIKDVKYITSQKELEEALK